jgi:hypothetical protein
MSWLGLFRIELVHGRPANHRRYEGLASTAAAHDNIATVSPAPRNRPGPRTTNPTGSQQHSARRRMYNKEPLGRI